MLEAHDIHDYVKMGRRIRQLEQRSLAEQRGHTPLFPQMSLRERNALCAAVNSVRLESFFCDHPKIRARAATHFQHPHFCTIVGAELEVLRCEELNEALVGIGSLRAEAPSPILTIKYLD